MRLSVPESMAAGSPLLSVFTRDQDSGAAGTVHYVLRSSSSTSEARLFAIDAATGVLTLTSSLDYETSQHYSLVITAYDEGEPRLQSNMTIFLDVQDMNDNTPVFEQSDYSIVVSESLPSHSQVIYFTSIFFPCLLGIYCFLFEFGMRLVVFDCSGDLCTYPTYSSRTF